MTHSQSDSWGGAAVSDNGAMLDMKSRNNANSPHSPPVTMTTVPPEVGGKSQEAGGGRTRGMHVFLFFFLFSFFLLINPSVWQVLYTFTQCTHRTVQTLLCDGIPPP